MRLLLILMLLAVAACGGGNGAPTPPRDTTPPAITLLGDNPQIIEAGQAYTELGATASDNLDGDLSTSIVIDASAVDTAVPGDYTVTYDVMDAAGNAATTVTRTVRVQNPPLPAAPTVSLETDIKKLVFSWDSVAGADYYRLLENSDGHSGFAQVGDDISAGTTSAILDIAVHFFDFANAQFIVEACNLAGCTGSPQVNTISSALSTIGYFKASNTNPRDIFGVSVAISGDGSILAIGASGEGSGAPGIDGDQSDNTLYGSGAVYVLQFDGFAWSQNAYIKASNPDAQDRFGSAIAISEDGSTLAVAALNEDSASTGVNGDQVDNSADGSGAVYLFRRNGLNWAQQAYLKASNTDSQDGFGRSVALSGDGHMLVVGAFRESSNATGLDGDQTDNSFPYAGAVYVFEYDESEWKQQAYVKASNNQYRDNGYGDQGPGDQFGTSVALDSAGTTLAVGAQAEYSNADGINGDQNNSDAFLAGAVYLFRYDGTSWTQQAYIKASRSSYHDYFGASTALSADGNTLAVGAPAEDSISAGINGDQSAVIGNCDIGAAYLFRFDGANWSQQAYIKASNPKVYGICDGFEGPVFGSTVTLSDDGNTLAVGSGGETSNAKGINGDQNDESMFSAGAVYVFQYDGFDWAQLAYVKASNTDLEDGFGGALDINAMGNTIVIGAAGEASNATGIGGDQSDNSAVNAGAVYIY